MTFETHFQPGHLLENTMKHTNTVPGFSGSASELADAIGDLYYDALAQHLRLLAQKMGRDSAADSGRGRHKLAGELMACAEHLAAAAGHIDQAWEICKPFVDLKRKESKP